MHRLSQKNNNVNGFIEFYVKFLYNYWHLFGALIGHLKYAD
jgi:hypothetical protein